MARKKLSPAWQITIGFIVVILVGAFLLMLPISSCDGHWFSFIDSLLMSTSAVSVTGVTVVNIASHFTLFGQIILLLLVQIGGLGFVTITSLIFLLIRKKITYAERKTIQESFNQDDDNVHGTVRMVRNICILVFVIELVGTLCLLPSLIPMYGYGYGIYMAIALSILAFCQAGFDFIGTANNNLISLSGFSGSVLVLLPIMLLIIIGGIGFLVLFDIGNRFKGKKLSLHSKITLSMIVGLLIVGTILFAVLEWNNAGTIGNMSVGEKILNASFFSTTTRTAGFVTFDCAQMSEGSIALTCILMFIGAGSASTAGGIKVTTLLCLIIAIFCKANKNGDFVFCKKRISYKIILKCLKILGGAILLITVGTFVICAVENDVTMTQAIFECISAITTCGLSLGITANLSWISEIVLVCLMFVGRIGLLTLSLVMSHKIIDNSQEIQYPDSKIMVG